MTATLQTDGDRSTLRFERRLAHDLERVWRAVTDPDELAEWFPSAVIYEPRVGAPMQFDFGGGAGQDPWPGEVLAWEPPHVFAFAWGTDELRFELRAEGGGTPLIFTHSFAHEPGKPARDGAGWETCFESFDALLAGSAQRAAPERWAIHHEEHLAAFGELAVETETETEAETETGARRVRLRGPYVEVGGRPAVSVELEGHDGPVVLVVGEDGRALADGAPVELRTGTPDDPGAPVASGVLRDPLATRAGRPG